MTSLRVLGVVSLSWAACGGRPLAPPDCERKGTCTENLGDLDTAAGRAPALPNAAYTVEIGRTLTEGGCGIVLAFAEASLASCRTGDLRAPASGGAIVLHLNSDSDPGTYELIRGWRCDEQRIGTYFDGSYADGSGALRPIVGGVVEVRTIGSAFQPLAGSYALEVDGSEGERIALRGDFAAEPCVGR